MNPIVSIDGGRWHVNVPHRTPKGRTDDAERANNHHNARLGNRPLESFGERKHPRDPRTLDGRIH
jgi:hypothetical protein